MDLFLPFYHNNDIGFSIINETRFKQRNNFISLNDTESFNSNQINSFVKAVKKFRLKNNNTIVLAGQVNYYGHNIINYQKTGGSVTGIFYTKNNTKTSVGYGITYDMNYHMSPIVPIIIYYKQLAAGYNIEMFLPWKIGVQRIVNPKTYLYLGSRLDVDLDLMKSENLPYNFNEEIVESRSTNVKSFSSLERSISQNIWLSLEIGYNHNFTSYITDVETVKEAEVDESYMSAKNFGGVYFNIGVFFRPQSPKK